MKKILAIGAAASSALLPVAAYAQTAAPTTLAGMAGGIDLSDTKTGILAGAGIMLGLTVLTMGVRWVKKQFA